MQISMNIWTNTDKYTSTNYKQKVYIPNIIECNVDMDLDIPNI